MNAFPGSWWSQSGAHRLCVGIDPHPELMHAWGLTDDARGLEQFGSVLTQAILSTGVAVAKPQVALFERHALEGLRVLAQIMATLREAGVSVIADVKRGDIGTSVRGYADAWLRPGSDFESDAMTVVAYQGVLSLTPVFELALNNHKGVFVLAATSNPEGWPIQSARVGDDGLSVAATVCQDLAVYAQQAPQGSSGALGVVVGATVDHAALGVRLGDYPQLSVLAPGFGAQGGRLEDIGTLFSHAPQRVIPAVSRSVYAEGPGRVAELIRQHQETLEQ